MKTIAQAARIAFAILAICSSLTARSDPLMCAPDISCDGRYFDPVGGIVSLASMPPSGVRFNFANGYLAYAIQPQLHVESGSNGNGFAEFFYAVRAAPQTQALVKIEGSFALLTDAPLQTPGYNDGFHTSDTTAEFTFGFAGYTPGETEIGEDKSGVLWRVQRSVESGGSASTFGEWTTSGLGLDSLQSSDGIYPGQSFLSYQPNHGFAGNFSATVQVETDAFGFGLVYIYLDASAESSQIIERLADHGGFTRETLPITTLSFASISAMAMLDPAFAIQNPGARVELLSVGQPVPESSQVWLLLAGLPICWWAQRSAKRGSRALGTQPGRVSH